MKCNSKPIIFVFVTFR